MTENSGQIILLPGNYEKMNKIISQFQHCPSHISVTINSTGWPELSIYCSEFIKYRLG